MLRKWDSNVTVLRGLLELGKLRDDEFKQIHREARAHRLLALRNGNGDCFLTHDVFSRARPYSLHDDKLRAYEARLRSAVATWAAQPHAAEQEVVMPTVSGHTPDVAHLRDCLSLGDAVLVHQRRITLSPGDHVECHVWLLKPGDKPPPTFTAAEVLYAKLFPMQLALPGYTMRKWDDGVLVLNHVERTGRLWRTPPSLVAPRAFDEVLDAPLDARRVRPHPSKREFDGSLDEYDA